MIHPINNQEGINNCMGGRLSKISNPELGGLKIRGVDDEFLFKKKRVENQDTERKLKGGIWDHNKKQNKKKKKKKKGNLGLFIIGGGGPHSAGVGSMAQLSQAKASQNLKILAFFNEMAVPFGSGGGDSLPEHYG
jgi:hypothetical protein